MKSVRLRTVAWIGAVILWGSVLGSLLLLLLRYCAVQESSARFMAVSGMAAQLLVVLCGVGTFGAVLTLGEIRQSARSWFLIGAVGVVVLWCVFFFVAAPTLASRSHRKANGATPEFSLVVQNLWYSNKDPDRTARDVLALAPQVVVLLEYTKAHADAFQSAGSAQKYPYRYEVAQPFGHGIAVLSTIPFTNPKDLGLSGAGVRVSLQLHQGVVDLYAVHFNSPSSIWDIPRWRSDFVRTTALLDQVGSSTVVAGDLNATEGHMRFRELLQRGRLTDAQDLASVGFATTWPASGRIPTLLRLDHILLGYCIELNSFSRLPPNGSDHLGLSAGLSLADMGC